MRLAAAPEALACPRSHGPEAPRRGPARAAGVLRVAVFATLGAAACTPGLPGPSPEHGMRVVMIAEDHRAATPAELSVLRAAAASGEAGVRAVAVRGIGRLERPDLIPDLLQSLEDDEPAVRRAAAFAIGQATSAERVDEVTMPLYLHLSRDVDEEVRAAAAHALGRLPYPRDELIADAWQALYRATQPPGEGHGSGGGRPASATMTIGVLRGLLTLARHHGEETPIDEESTAWLRARLGDPDTAPRSERTRPLALATLHAAGRLSVDDALAGLDAADIETRRRAAALSGESEAVRARALDDPAGAVRTAGLAALRGTELRCEIAAGSIDDPSPHARLQAIALLTGCRGAEDLLHEVAAGLAGRAANDWHEPAAALVALRGNADLDTALLETFATHPIWQVRMYAARAADERALWTLRVLSADSMPNVRHAAIERLGELGEDAADVSIVALLHSDDPQLLLTAAVALEDTRATGALEALSDALSRLDARGAMTDRDARAALLRRIAELAPPGPSPILDRHLADFDPVIAELAAELRSGRGQEPLPAAPRPAAGLPFPSLEELERLANARVRVRMARGGTFVLRLLPSEAPTAAARFAGMVRERTFDGLTFHRVVANFVVQGGSPGANEYAGHGEYTRDEITDRSHLRGTVGISTRGRDTGDGQIFVNLVDNYRLDGDYTIFAEVVEGMEVVDGVMEGDTILAAEILDTP